MAALCTMFEWLFMNKVLTWLSKSTGIAIPRFFALKGRKKKKFTVAKTWKSYEDHDMQNPDTLEVKRQGNLTSTAFKNKDEKP